MRNTGKAKIVAAGIMVSLVAVLWAAAAASAKTVSLKVYNGIYPAGSFTGSDAVGASEFTFGVDQIDVDKNTGNVYVSATSGGGHVYKFDANGVSQPFSALAPNTAFPHSFNCCNDLEVDNSATASQGRIYVLQEYGPIDAYLPTGAPVGGNFPLGNLGDVCGAAVSQDGHLWRSLYGTSVYEYYSSGNATGKVLNFASSPQFCDFEIDSQGNFYVPAPYYGGEVRKYSPTGVDLGQIDPGPAQSVAIDLSNDHVFVDNGNVVNEYDATGAFIGSFGGPDPARSYPGLSGSRGIAVNPTTHKVYVGNGSRVDTFIPTGPNGVPTTDCHFEVSTSAANYSTASVPCAEGSIFAGSSDQAVTAVVSGLTL